MKKLCNVCKVIEVMGEIHRDDRSKAETIKLGAVGDIALTHRYSEILKKKAPSFPFAKISPYLSTFDIVFGNLEGPITKEGTTYPNKCSLRIEPAYACVLRRAGFNVLNLANNHILDYGNIGLLNTIQALERNKIRYIGAGKDIKEARTPVIIEKNNVKVGFLGYCNMVIDSPFYASERNRGIAPLDMSLTSRDIRSLRTSVDVVIVSLHWGIENSFYPSPEQILAGRCLIEEGADLVLGHHPHVIQGIEKYRRGYIVYSLGNFIFSDIEWSWHDQCGKERKSRVPLEQENKISFIFVAELTANGVTGIDILPCYLGNDMQVKPWFNNKSAKSKVLALSKKIGRDNYDRFWRQYCLAQKCRRFVLSWWNRSKQKIGLIH